MTEEFVSEVKQIPHNDERIFTMLSDLSNLERIKDRIPQDKIKNFEIVEREPNKLIKFTTTNSPVPLFLWIQLKQVAEDDTRLKITVRADLNPFLKPMVSKPLQEAVDKISTVIASLPY